MPKNKWIRQEVAERYIRRYRDQLNADRTKAWQPRPDYNGDDWRVMCMFVGYSKAPRKVLIIPK